MPAMKKYETLSYKYKIAHYKASGYYSKWNIRLNLSNIAIVSFIGIANNITSITDTNNKALSVSYSIVLYFSVLLGACQQFLRYEELAEKHRVISVRYNHLYNLCLLSQETDLNSIIEEYENIYNNSPLLPDHLKDITVEQQNQDNNVIDLEGIDVATAHQLNRMIVQSFKN